MFLLKNLCAYRSSIHSHIAIPANENGFKWIEIFFYPNAYFKKRILFLDLIESNWIQLDSIGCNWIEKLHFLFKILN